MEPEQPPAADPRCGTYAGYQQHSMLKQPPCEPCLEANRAYHRAYEAAWNRARTRLAKLYPDDFSRFLDEERQKVPAGDAR